MGYDFTTLHPPFGSGAPMWERLRSFGEPQPDAIDLGVAEMKFRISPEIEKAVTVQARTGTFGYSGAPDSFTGAVCEWMKTRHGWEIEKDWIAQTYGLVPAIGYSIRALTEPGDAVLVNFPAYRPFPMTVADNGRRLERSDLVLRDGKYVMDMEDMERRLSSPEVTAYILCNPHNPTGRVWTREELLAVDALCRRYGVRVISDEIHFDIAYPGHPQTVFASLSPEAAANTVTLTAPSKTFNIAGMTVSNVIISDSALREKVWGVMRRDMGHYINAFGFAACEAAYRCGADWLDGCLGTLEHNCGWFRAFLAERVPVFSCCGQEGTYLVWMDCSRAGLSPAELDGFLWNDARFYSEQGGIFGEGYELFHRVNLACPFEYVEAAALRLEAAAKRRGLV